MSALKKIGVAASIWLLFGCDAGSHAGQQNACSANGACDGGLTCVSNACAPGTSVSEGGGALIVSAATRRPRTTTWSVNYWQWLHLADGTTNVTGSESLIGALAPALVRIGGYNNDANKPESFDNAELDAAVRYARAVGAEPMLQVPLLADLAGNAPTAETAAAMVTYANVSQGYHIKYFSIGNEPDLYATQGSLTSASGPAIPGYTPAQFCASARAFVSAMKAVDPTIQIIGPELSHKYQGAGDNDWLTPILDQCGDLFDIVSVHRYPFAAKQATLPAAEADVTVFRNLVPSLRRVLQATHQDAKPLALTEMNIAYDSMLCVLDASPGTVGSALWMADSLGAAIDLGLWTSAVWDISDADDWGLGLLGMPPAHTPRPAYHAYALFADHFGPVLADVITAPPHVSAYASRNAADDATEIIVVSWNTEPVSLDVRVTGLDGNPPAAPFVLPASSIAAIEIPDQGAPSAWTYGEAQRKRASGPEPLAAGSSSGNESDAVANSDSGVNSDDASAGRVPGVHCGADAPGACPSVTLPSPELTTQGAVTDTGLTFGSQATIWESYAYAGAGQSTPEAMLSADGNGMQINASFVTPITQAFAGVGLFFDGLSCIDASHYTGLKFDFSGDLGGCLLALGVNFHGDDSLDDDPMRGGCPSSDSTCYAPAAPVTFSADAGAGAGTIEVPFAAIANGSPIAKLDPRSIVAVQWQISPPRDNSACNAHFTVTNVAFY